MQDDQFDVRWQADPGRGHPSRLHSWINVPPRSQGCGDPVASPSPTELSPEPKPEIRGFDVQPLCSDCSTSTAETRWSQHDLFRLIADTTSDWESWIDADGVTRWINPAVERFTGYSVTDCLERHDYPIGFVHPEDQATFAEILRTALAGRSGNDVEFRILHRDGSIRWAAISWQSMVDSHDQPMGFRTSIRDISVRKRLEAELRAERDALEAHVADRTAALETAYEALRNREALLRGFLDHVPAGVALKGLDGHCLMANARYSVPFGLDPEALIGRSVEELLAPDQAAEARRREQLVLEQDAPRQFEDRHGPIEHPTVTSTLVFPIREADGTPCALGLIVRDVTRQRLAEQVQAEWKTRYEEAASAAGLVLYEWDCQADHLTFGGACEQVFGYSPKELEGGIDRWIELIHPDDREAFVEDLRISSQPGNAFHGAYRVLTRQGGSIVLQDDGSYFPEESDRPARFIGFLADITQQAQASEALRTGEQRFRAIFDQTFQFAAILLPDGTVLQANDHALEFGGLTPDDVIGKPFWECRWWTISPEVQQRLQSAIAQAAAGASVRYEEQVRGAGDATAFIDFSIKPICDASGAVTLLIPEATDITERKQSERQLEAALGELQAIMEAVPDILFVLDLDGRLIRWNHRLEQLTGLTPNELDGRQSVDFFPPEEEEQVIEAMSRVYAEGAATYQGHLLRRLGDPCPVHITAAPLRDPSGAVIGMAGVTRDMSDRLELEAELREQAEAVEAINRVGLMLASELDLGSLVQAIADAAVSLTGAGFAVLFTEAPNEDERIYRMFTSSGSDHLESAEVPGLSWIELLRPMFRGQGIIRLDDARLDPHFQRVAGGSSDGPSLVSCMALPLVGPSGAILGAILLGHERPGVFTERSERLVAGLTAQAAIALENARLVAGLEHANTELEAAYDATIAGWSRALDFRDHETEGHSRRVTALTLQLAQRMGVSEAELVHLRRGALLHDIGKMAIPDRILNKPGPLDESERAVMERHPVLAHAMLAPIPFLQSALDIPYCHHERWDGNGYPRGLVGEQIPLAARIFAAVDIYDALRSDRPYRSAWTECRTRNHLRRLSGSHLDPEVVRALIQMLEEIEGSCHQVAQDRGHSAIECQGEAAPPQLIPSRHSFEAWAVPGATPGAGAGWLNLLMEQISNLLTIVEVDGTIRWESPSLDHLLGYQSHEVIGTNVFSYVHEDDLPGIRAAFEDLLRDPSYHPALTLRIRHRDGSWRVLEAVGSNLLNHPTFRGLLFTSRDVTDHVQAETALREGEETLRSFFDSVPMMMAIVEVQDDEPRLVKLNTSAAQHLGLDPASLREEPRPRFYLSPEHRTLWNEAFRSTQPGQGPAHFEYLDQVNPNGPRWLDVSISAIASAGQGRQRYACVVQDTTERKRAELALSRSEDRFRQLFLGASIGIAIIDKQGLIEAVNPRCAFLLGETSARLTGLRFSSLLREPLQPLVQDIFEDCPSGKLVYGGTLEVTDANGQLRHVQLDATRIMGFDGCHRWAAFMIDVTDRVRAEQQLARLASVDALTGLANRHALDAKLNAAIAQSERLGGSISLVMLDVDRFKRFNDDFGHPAGDEVLRSLASILGQILRPYDCAIRYGGEEFLIILPGADAEAGLQIAERLREAIAARSWPLRPITASLGVSTGLAGTSARDLLIGQADQALYQAKRSGRNRVILHHAP
ncbi:PAS domain S-box protein [Tautonia marina]|uniref:PAS domain S-box protein n=1 Tax=Tautonia marina TaxID=2653855 RepID=UPI0013758BDC|nr:PAS domain S-box protein [Tautonia marina]